MLDYALTGFFLTLLALGLRRGFVWVLAYIYIDIFQPQRIATGVLDLLQPSLLAFVLAVGGWLMQRNGQRVQFHWRQGLIVALLVYCGISTQFADFANQAMMKWDWVWKVLLFAAFMPLTLTTRLRLEGATLVLILAAACIIIDGALKTLTGGGGYDELHLFVNNNTSIYEGSTLSCVAIAIIPQILWCARWGTVFPPDWRVKLFAAALIFACLLIPVGTAARTGLICVAVLGLLLLLTTQRRAPYLGVVAAGLVIAVPLLPASYTQRMGTINHASADESAATRLAVWQWTIDYADSHPFGGGFEVYRGNKLDIHLSDTGTDASGNGNQVNLGEAHDKARAFHSSYFEMLGEQGWPGLAMWLTLQISGLVQMAGVRRRLKGRTGAEDRADAAMSTALLQGHVVFLVGAAFVGIAFQSFVYMLIALEIALAGQVRARQAVVDAPAQPAVALPVVGVVPAL